MDAVYTGKCFCQHSLFQLLLERNRLYWEYNRVSTINFRWHGGGRDEVQSVTKPLAYSQLYQQNCSFVGIASFAYVGVGISYAGKSGAGINYVHTHSMLDLVLVRKGLGSVHLRIAG